MLGGNLEKTLQEIAEEISHAGLTVGDAYDTLEALAENPEQFRRLKEALRVHQHDDDFLSEIFHKGLQYLISLHDTVDGVK